MTQERMHPEDARRELAMEFFKLCTEHTRQNCIAFAVDSADALLAELARTAKPEDEPEFLAWRQKAWDNASRAEKAEARVRELEDAIKKPESPKDIKDALAPFGRQPWHCEYCGMVVDGGTYHDCKENTLKARAEQAEARVKELEKKLASFKEAGAKACESIIEEERERIIGLISGESLYGVYALFAPFAPKLSAHGIRAILEAKR